jgi:hypothetical protein
MGMAHGLEGGGVNALFFIENTIGRQPIAEVQVFEALRKISANTSEQNRHASGFRFPQEMFEAFEEDDIRIPRPLDPEDDVANIIFSSWYKPPVGAWETLSSSSDGLNLRL